MTHLAPARPELALTPFERFSLGLARVANGSPPLSASCHLVKTQLVRPLVRLVCRGRLRLSGMEHVRALESGAGVLLAANHRSFFDLFVIAACLGDRTDLCGRVYFPVRSNFWYDHPAGVVLNAATGMAMFPPIFRASDKRAMTRRGLDLLARELQRPGTLVGMHPEGTRSREQDPYTLLPAEQSFGRLALRARCTILPAFVIGLSNSLLFELRAATRPEQHSIHVAFGPPLDPSEFTRGDPDALRAQLEVGTRVLRAIAELGEHTRAAVDRDQSRAGARPNVTER